MGDAVNVSAIISTLLSRFNVFPLKKALLENGTRGDGGRARVPL